MNGIVNTIKVAPKKAIELIMKHPISTVLVIIIIILSAVLIKKEHFDGMVEGLKTYAEYPVTFAEKLVSGEAKGISYENYFLPATEKVEPSAGTASTQLELPQHEATVKVDIGNGLAVDAKVQVPAQTVDVPSQTPIAIPEAKKTDVTVAAQTVQIPAQTGAMPASVEGTDKSVIVPVSIPAQVVSIPEQKAVVPVIEPFSMM